MATIDSRLAVLACVVLTACGGGSESQQPTQAQSQPAQAATLLHVVHMGQSLASGDDSYPLISMVDTGGGNYRFARGVHTWEVSEPGSAQDRPASDFSLVPLTETDWGGTGETIGNGLADTLRPAFGSGAHILFTYAGQGSKRLRELDFHDECTDPRDLHPTKGGYYATALDDVKRAQAAAEANGWSYKVEALTWMQGEKNGDLRISDWDTPARLDVFVDAYATDIINLKNTWNHDVKAETGQADRVPMFTYQTALAIAGQAQLVASDRDPEIIVVGPTYQMEHADTVEHNGRYGSYLHLDGDGQRWLGAQFAKVMRRVLVEHETWQPLRPVSATLGTSRTTVDVVYHVPRPPLMVDTTFLAQQPGFGFEIPGGPAITGARVIGDDTLELTLAEALPAGSFTLQYTAVQHDPSAVPRGNIRDSDPEPSSYTFQRGPHNGERYPMWNWGVAFEGMAVQ